jgi:hypothetical protein
MVMVIFNHIEYYQKLLSSHLFSKMLKIRIYKVTLLFILYGWETLYFALREEHNLHSGVLK